MQKEPSYVQVKCGYHKTQIAECNDRQLFQLVDRLFKPSTALALPDHTCKKDLANELLAFFHGKVSKLRNTLDNMQSVTASIEIPELSNNSFASFQHVCTDDIRKIITKSANKSCALDPLPTDLLTKCLDVLLPNITRIINMSLSSVFVPETLKVAQVIPLIKKTMLERNKFYLRTTDPSLI